VTTPRAVGRTEQRCDLYRRAFDVVVSTVLVLIVVPVIIAAALGSWISLRAWPFFVQERVGKDGRAFRFVKVRTLPRSFPTYADKHQLSQAHIPGFCRGLRRLHLDELPQLLLVVRGRMSLVGPRPEMAPLHDLLTPAFAELRTSTRPGCTGLWQISEACSDLIGTAPEYDRFYLANRTLRLDLWVLGRTAQNMLGFERRVALADVPRWALRADDTGRVIDLRDVLDLDQDRAEVDVHSLSPAATS
jgi:lipopolysaccharide/colanic/teichoic acid biosynthesis glycosyltransferase